MEEKKIDCYLCNSSAVGSYAPDASRILLVECKTCKSYLLTTGVRLFYTHRKDGGELSSQAKEKLSKYIQKKHEQTDVPVLLTPDMIEAVTGIRSENKRY